MLMKQIFSGNVDSKMVHIILLPPPHPKNTIIRCRLHVAGGSNKVGIELIHTQTWQLEPDLPSTMRNPQIVMAVVNTANTRKHRNGTANAASTTLMLAAAAGLRRAQRFSASRLARSASNRSKCSPSDSNLNHRCSACFRSSSNVSVMTGFCSTKKGHLHCFNNKKQCSRQL